MQLGTKVSFTHQCKRNGNYFDFEDGGNVMNEDIEKVWDGGTLTLEKLDVIELDKPLVGVIAGKRNIVQSHDFGVYDFGGLTEADIIIVSTKLKPVYLVAVNMTGFYRVPMDAVTTI